MPAKVFDAFTRLDASDVNAYLANKSISNAIINGAFDIWQRGTSGFSGFVYTADRFVCDNANVVSRSTDVPSSIGVTYSLRHAATTGNAATRVALELSRLGSPAPFSVGTTWTLSFWAKSTATRNLSVSADFRTSVVGTGEGTALSSTVVGQSSSTWQRFSTTFTIPSVSLTNSNCLSITFSSTAGASMDFFITGVQLEEGTVANDFRRNANSIQGELAACQRYYIRYTGTSTGTSISPVGGSVSATIGETVFSLPSTFRLVPTSIEVANLGWYNFANTTIYTGGTTTIQGGDPSTAKIRYTHGSSVLTAGQTGQFVSGSGVGFIGISAEL